ncbi:hypothetical protein [Thiohalobacter thiocyanaticus]|uniref:hypothetical protein n=1 Tax=Thiohalobacter thiocyanaticus TaxID=585455 RepID=UPI000F636F15|nr:hypothetical protein [Thiohalobacter thiocyanaticus]
MNRSESLRLLIPLLGLLCVSSVHGETRRDGDDPALRKAQYQLRQLSQENNALQGQLTQLQAEKAELEAELETLREEHQNTESRLDRSRDTNEQLVERINADVERYKQLMARYQESVTTLRGLHADNRHLVRAVQEREAWIEECRGNNDRLFEANADLLKRYRDVAVSRKEPFTGIGRVRVENEYQDYRFKLEDLQVMEFESSVNVERHRREPPEQIAAREEGRTADGN